MALLDQVDNYCERLEPGLWAEPLNALTNLAFLAAAFWVWASLGGRRDPGARALVGILVAIGLGSLAFHTFATGWAAILDVVPILGFILVYLYFATRRLLGASPLWSLAATAGFLPFAAVVSSAARALVGPLNGSVAYLPVPLLILIYAALMARRDLVTARGLALGAAILVGSIVFRTLDKTLCPALPFGTHFLWHILNAVMLGWMILVLHRHDPRPR